MRQEKAPNDDVGDDGVDVGGDDDVGDDDDDLGDDGDNVWHESVTPSLREPSPGERERTRPGGEQV